MFYSSVPCLYTIQRQVSQLLLQMSTGKVDNEYVNDLEAKLTQARQEIRDLMEQSKQLQDRQVS